MTQPVALYTSRQCLAHDTGEEHPEHPTRLQAVLKSADKAVKNSNGRVVLKDAAIGTKEQVCLMHDAAYFDALEKTIAGLSPTQAYVNTDIDTRVSKGSLDAALYGVGAACQAVDDVLSGNTQHGFCLTRPPGHHALRASSMGFCLFGNVAIAAAHALKNKGVNNGVNKVVIIDFDVHHGNGTQDLVQNSPDITLFSLHQTGLWPYEHTEDRGKHNNIYNIEIPTGSPASAYHDAFDTLIMPTLDALSPELIIISAGFDAHRDDPPKDDALFNDPPGRQNLLEDDFAIITEKLANFGTKRTVSVLEGGYDVDVLASCCLRYIQTLDKCAKP